MSGLFVAVAITVARGTPHHEGAAGNRLPHQPIRINALTLCSALLILTAGPATAPATVVPALEAVASGEHAGAGGAGLAAGTSPAAASATVSAAFETVTGGKNTRARCAGLAAGAAAISRTGTAVFAMFRGA